MKWSKYRWLKFKLDLRIFIRKQIRYSSILLIIPILTFVTATFDLHEKFIYLKTDLFKKAEPFNYSMDNTKLIISPVSEYTQIKSYQAIYPYLIRAPKTGFPTASNKIVIDLKKYFSLFEKTYSLSRKNIGRIGYSSGFFSLPVTVSIFYQQYGKPKHLRNLFYIRNTYEQTQEKLKLTSGYGVEKFKSLSIGELGIKDMNRVLDNAYMVFGVSKNNIIKPFLNLSNPQSEETLRKNHENL